MISYAEAVALLKENAPRRPAVSLPLASALGCVAAQDIIAPFAVPPFDNSAMDGFAVRREDCATSVTLPVQNITAAGSVSEALKPRHAMQIMTGAPLPSSADAVIAIEDVTVTRDQAGRATAIAIQAQPKPRQNIRAKGEDFQIGDVLAKSGTRLTPHHIMGLAALGVGSVAVQAMPEIIVVATGNELHEAGRDAAQAAFIIPTAPT